MQLDQWISRKIFIPSREPVPGFSREYTLADVIRLTLFATLSRLGFPLTILANEVWRSTWEKMHGFHGEAAYLLIWDGPVVFPSFDTSGPAVDYPINADVGAEPSYYDPPSCWPGQRHSQEMFPYPQSRIVPASYLSKWMVDPEVHALTMVDLDRLEKRVINRLNVSA